MGTGPASADIVASSAEPAVHHQLRAELGFTAGQLEQEEPLLAPGQAQLADAGQLEQPLPYAR
ncbi:MAG TPA: hypothetical protein VI299_04240, partial [Polyangiales bacterium]